MWARENKVVDGVDMDISRPASDAQKTAAQSAIRDYNTIPASYREAVKTCFALKLLNGDNGSFLGANTMTRAEACAVIRRMDGLVSGGAVTEPDPVPTNTPAPDQGTTKEITVTTRPWSGNATDSDGNRTDISGTRWDIVDNRFGDGYLNNGKPITEENVIELLHEAEKIWPYMTKWSESGSDNNFYGNSGSVVSRMMKTSNTGTSRNVSTNFGCSGFAAIISDYIFGRDVNNFHRVASVNDIRPGDIIIEVTNNKVIHVVFAVTASGGSYTGLNGTTAVTRNGYVHIAQGNTSDKVSWPNKFSAPLNENSNDTTTWQVYIRYPN